MTKNSGGSAPRPPKRRQKESALGRIARAIDAAGHDADLARRQASDPQFRRAVRDDRRGTLSRFRTVKHALEDREKIERSKRASPPSKPPKR